jgi:hypothetical protein
LFSFKNGTGQYYLLLPKSQTPPLSEENNNIIIKENTFEAFIMYRAKKGKVGIISAFFKAENGAGN